MAHIIAKLVERSTSLLLGLGQRRILNNFVNNADGMRNAVNIFQGKWVSRFPEYLGVQAGSVPLFEDGRIRWAAERFDVRGKSVLELGPLEGGHSYILEQLGAARILAIEANTHSFLKCLIVKELFQLNNTHFLCENFVEHLRQHTDQQYDICIASGVLYHMANPVELLELIATVADRVFLWTHYYDEAKIRQNPKTSRRFKQHLPAAYQGFQHTLHRREYGIGLFSWRGIGGIKTFSHWLTQDDITGALAHFGMGAIEIGFDDPDNPSGPSFALTALRQEKAHG